MAETALVACPTGTPFTARSYVTLGMYTGKSPPLLSPNTRSRLTPSIRVSALPRTSPVSALAPSMTKFETVRSIQSTLWNPTWSRLAETWVYE